MASNSIGEFPFVILTNPVGRNGAPLLTREENEIIQRPGVHGTGIRRLGVKGVTFQMISMRDSLSFLAAGQEYRSYTLLTGDDVAQSIIWKGVDYDGFGVRYSVLDVSDPDITPIRNNVGGLLGSLATAKLTVTWTLQPVLISQLGGKLTQG